MLLVRARGTSPTAKPQRKNKIMSQFGFNLSDYENVDTGASADFSPIPPGQYQLLIEFTQKFKWNS